jgi:hypothetical protein
LTARPIFERCICVPPCQRRRADTLKGADHHLSTVPPEPGGGTRALSALPHSAPRHAASCGIPNSAPGFRGKAASKSGTDGCAPTGCGGVAMPSLLTPHYARGHVVPVVSLARQPRLSLSVSRLPHHDSERPISGSLMVDPRDRVRRSSIKLRPELSRTCAWRWSVRLLVSGDEGHLTSSRSPVSYCVLRQLAIRYPRFGCDGAGDPGPDLGIPSPRRLLDNPSKPSS